MSIQRYSPDQHPITSVFAARLNLMRLTRIRLESPPALLSDIPESFTVKPAEEGILHVLSGTVALRFYGTWGKQTVSRLGNRNGIFDGLPSCVTIRPNTSFTAAAVSRYADLLLAVGFNTALQPGSPTVLRPEDVQVHNIGHGSLRREVREVVGGNGISDKLRLGETINSVGGWSSWPHHDFTADPTRAKHFEEVFLYFTHPRNGYGFQKRHGIFGGSGEIFSDVAIIHNGDYAILPLGEHPAVAGPDTRLAYVWVYVSPVAKKYAKWAEDGGEYA